MFATAAILAVVGLAMTISGWLFFRRPGVEFWTLAPVWRANHYLYPRGVALWIIGGGIANIGFVLLAIHAYRM